MSICAVFKSHTEWNNAQRVSAPSTTILLSSVGTFYLAMIYASHTCMYQNIAKTFDFPVYLPRNMMILMIIIKYIILFYFYWEIMHIKTKKQRHLYLFEFNFTELGHFYSPSLFNFKFRQVYLPNHHKTRVKIVLKVEIKCTNIFSKEHEMIK